MPSPQARKYYSLIRRLFGIADLIAGLAGVLFFLIGPSLFGAIKGAELFSSVFFIALAPPLLVMIMGLVMFLKTRIGPALTLFSSMLLFINSLAALFSRNPPFFLAADTDPSIAHFFGFATPLAAVIFFGLHGITSFAGMILEKEARTAVEKIPLRHPEFFCANCDAALKPEDTVCPSCKAVIRGIHCVACGFEGSEEDFKENKCPQCGEKSV